MCGMGAILDPAGAVAAGAGQAMVAELRHRGPDGEAVDRFGPATLIHTRLAIMDVAGGDQPLRSEDGEIAVVVNGEIYNQLDLRSELEAKGHRFATRSDSEVVVHLYEELGLDAFARLNGIYGLALWDARRRRLVAARDPFGVKPVYYWSDGRRVALASEITSLLATGLVRAEVDRVALDHYLAMRFVPAPRTLFAGISKLPSASMLVCEENAAPRIDGFREAPGAPLHDASPGELRERFVDAVGRQMMSDVPYGAFLSGGVDSAAVVSAMARRSDAPPTTFTIGFPGAGDVIDERAVAERTARALGTDHHATAMEESDFLDELERTVRRLEEPCAIPSAPALMQLSRFAAQSVKVVLSGQGADEPHGGYGRHQAAALLRPLSRLGFMASPLARAAALAPRVEKAQQVARLLGPMSDGERLLRLVEVTPPEQRTRLATGAAGDEAAAERLALVDEVRADVGDRPLLDQALYVDAHVFLPDRLLICGDKMSMAHALEMRVPFLDVELMRWVERVPGRERVRLRRPKRLHREAMAGLVPREALDRPKHGFSTPYDRWLHTSLGAEMRRRTDDPALGALLEPTEIRRLVDEHLGHRADHKRLLYALLELSTWHRAFLAGEPAPAPASVAAG